MKKKNQKIKKVHFKNPIFLAAFFLVLSPLCAHADWETSLKEALPQAEVVETFDNLQDWSPAFAPNGRSTSGLPLEQDGSASMWDLWDYWSAQAPLNTPWIGNHGENSWSGKSLRLDLSQGTSAKSGPSRFGLYFGSLQQDGIDPYSTNGIVESGYRDDIHIFYMAKFPANAFPKDENGFVYFGYYKFNTCSLGFVSASEAQEGSDDYGAANIHPHIQTGASVSNHLRLTLRYASDADWPGVLEYSTVSGAGELDNFVDDSEWFGVEFHIHRGTPGMTNGYQEIWVYDKEGNAFYAGKSADTMLVPAGKDWGFNRFWFGGNLSFDTTNLDPTYYVDDFVVSRERIGPSYFAALAAYQNPAPTYAISDFFQLVSDWFTSNASSDFNGDNLVNSRDLGILMGNWR